MPVLLQYLIPGAWCITLYKFSFSKKISEKSYFILSCVISYVLLSITSILKMQFFKEASDNAIVNSAISIIIGTLIVVLITIFSQRKWFKKLTVKVLHKTLNDDIWRDIFDLEKGSNLKIYLKNKDYYIIGHLKNYDEKGNDSWIALSAFAKFDVDTNKNYKNEISYLNNSNVYIACRFSEIDHIEIF